VNKKARHHYTPYWCGIVELLDPCVHIKELPNITNTFTKGHSLVPCKILRCVQGIHGKFNK